VLDPLTGHVEAVVARVGLGIGVTHDSTSALLIGVLQIEMKKPAVEAIKTAIAKTVSV
jgi:hypothetical protein